jgi:hypothetical protein
MVLPFGMLLELLLRRHRLFEGVDGKSTLRDFVEVVRERPVYRTLRWASRKLHLGQAGVRSFSALNLVWTLCLASALTIPIAFAVQQNYREGARNTRVAHAKSDVQTLAFAIKRYEAQMAVLPNRLDDLILPATDLRGERVGPFLERLPEPPRGYSAYRYERRGTNGFSISTSGDREAIEDRR